MRKNLAIIFILAATTALVYLQSLSHSFAGMDIGDYITNAHLNAGLNIESIKWAFTSVNAANWHPVTMIFHLLNRQLFGLNPMGHHFVNITLHIINSILLFYLLNKITGATYRSAIVAGFFALHPLHVESVAWAAELKDVLSTLFFFLALISYCKYTITNRAYNYYITVLLYILGLMSKPMLVTAPRYCKWVVLVNG